MWAALTARYPSAARLPLGLDGGQALAAVRVARLVGRGHEDRPRSLIIRPHAGHVHVNTGGSNHRAAGCGPTV